MFQGSKEMERLNYEGFSFDPRTFSAMILTHAHLDHCGRIPKLVKFGFKGKIFATNATRELANIIMLDAAKIAAEDTKHENKRRAREGLPPRKPIYNISDVQKAMKLFVTVKYSENVNVTKNIIACFYDAGHILGASSVQLQIREGNQNKILAFSGDLGQLNSVLVKNTEPIKKADYVFIESTYGDRLHPPTDERRKELIRVINESYKRGGKLMIPAFAVERAQEMLYYIGDFMEKGLIPKMPVFLDSPMAAKATEVFIKYSSYYNPEVRAVMVQRKNLFNFPNLTITSTVNESKKLNDLEGPCIIIAGNGMCTGGRIKHHIRNSIDNPKNTLMFVGYQVRGTLGYWIKQGQKRVRLLGTEVDVRAKIETIDGFSAHADYKELITWLENYSPKPKKVFIIHGDDDQAQAFSKKIGKEGFNSYVPNLWETIKV
jgi:metallo-beta-lactamase family protein